MKLAIIRQRYNPFGGAERFVERALSGLSRVVSFIVAGVLLLGMGVGYAQALERARRHRTPVDNPEAPAPAPPTV